MSLKPLPNMSSQSSSSLLSSLPPLSFHTVIEADHNHISSLASQFLQHLSSLDLPQSHVLSSHPIHNTNTSLSSLLTNILTHLIRHDISEDLVMRPAFTKFLPLNDEGTRMANHDRHDHIELKARMLGIARLIDKIDGPTNTNTKEDIMRIVKDLFRDMKRHMDEESGGQLIHFRDVLRNYHNQSRSLKLSTNSNSEMENTTVANDIEMDLGKEYVLTLVLTPDVEICTSPSPAITTLTPSSQIDTSDASSRTKCFPGGVQQYISAPQSRFRDIMTKLVEDASTGRDKGYLSQRVKEELKILGLGIKGSETKL